MKKEPIHIVPQCGDNVNSFIRKALRLAWLKNRVVKFTFNDHKFTVHKRLSERHLRKQWDHMVSASSARWRNSREGREYLEERAREIAQKQSEIDTLMAGVTLTTNLDEILYWFEQFTPLANSIVSYDGAAIVQFLKNNGYVMNEGVGESEEYFKNKVNVGRYIIGQCMDCLNSGMPPREGCLYSFIEKYNNIEDEITKG